MRKWHFQIVHHDIWDYDTPMAPNLLDVTVNGRPRKIIASTDEAGLGLRARSRDRRADLADVETPVLQSEVPGEQTSPTQPIPSQARAVRAAGMLVESDLIDYTPAIKDSALKLAQKCRMGPYFIPASPADGKGKNGSTLHVLVVRAGRERRREHRRRRGGRSGNGHDLRRRRRAGMSTIAVAKDPCSELRLQRRRTTAAASRRFRRLPLDRDGAARAVDAAGCAAGAVRSGARRSPARSRRAAPRRRGDQASAASRSSSRRSCGGVTAYNMNTGDKKWWMPNGGFEQVTSTDPMFAGVTLPPAGGRGPAAGHHDEDARHLRHRPQRWRRAARRRSSTRSTRRPASRSAR